MTRPFDPKELTAHRLRLIGSLLAEAAFVVSLRETRAGLELTAALTTRSRSPVSVEIAEGGHTQFRFWTDPSLHPRQITAALVQATDHCRALSPPERGSLADFHQRNEHLPPNHPSSPYESDGSPKPSGPDLSSRELSLPDEQGIWPGGT